MVFVGDQNPKVGSTLSMDASRKRKRRNGLSVADTLKLWSQNEEAKHPRKAPAKDSDSVATTSNAFSEADFMTVSPESEICGYHAFGEGERMNVEFPVDSEAPSTSGVINTTDEFQHAKPEEECMKETDYSWLNGLDFSDDIPIIGGPGVWDVGSYFSEDEVFNIDEILG
ncbi:hypothetical protein SCA6_000612 [Theobroma cacao]